MSRRQLSILPVPIVVACCVLIAAAGPGPAAAAKPLSEVEGRVVVWYETALEKGIPLLAAEFKKVAPKVQVDWVLQDPNQLQAKLVAALSAQVGPDIVLASQKRLTTAEQQFQAWADLASYQKSDKEFADMMAALPPVHVKSYLTGTKQWGLPGVVQESAMFVRKSWMDEVGGKPPTDWQEMTDLAKKLTKPTRFGMCIFGAPGVTNSVGMQYIYLASAAGMQHYLIDEGGKPTFNAPEAVGVAKWLHRWQHVDKITSPATPSWTHKELYAGIQGGQCAMGRIGGWNVAAWEAQPQPGKDFVVFGYPPMVKGQKSPAYQYSWSDGIVLAAKPKSPEAAVAYFKFLMGKQAQTILFPVRSSWARTDLDFAKLMAGDERMLYFAKPRPYAADLSYHPFFLPILDILSRHLNAMIADPKSDPEKTMRVAYDESMAKYKEMGGK